MVQTTPASGAPVGGIVGKSIPKLDAFPKVTGDARYGADIRLPGLLQAKLLCSPYAHARVTRIDTSEAERLPGVLAVLTKDNTSKVRFNASDADELNLLPFPAVMDQVIFDDRVRYAGEPVAAVAATSLEIAERAVELIQVEYEELPAVFDAHQALADDAPRVHDGAQNNLAGFLPIVVGDPEAGFAQADVVVEQTFSTSRQKQCQMEPQACVASVEPNGKLTVWSPSQNPHLARHKLARIFDLPQSRVRVISPHLGGAFGVNVGVTIEAYVAALALAARRPVRLVLTRDEVFVCTNSRHPIDLTLKMGFQRDGTVTAIEAKAISNTGAYATQGLGVTGALTLWLFRLYPCPNWKFDGSTVYTNTPVSGSFRGYGGPQGYFALEQVIDLAAERLGLDPLELRRKISLDDGQYDADTQQTIQSFGLRECFDRGAAAIGWPERRSLGAGEGTRRRGIGMGSVGWVSGTACMSTPLDAAAAVVIVNEDGSATLVSGACDLGTGAKTALAQIAAEELGILIELMQISDTDTDLTPFDAGAHASRTAYQAGNAARVAAADAREQVRRFVADQLEASVDDLELVDGEFVVRGAPEQRMPWREAAERAFMKSMQFIGRGQAPQANDSPSGAQFVEVEVDTETGVVRVLRIVAAHDVGRAINPLIVEGQIEGALQQGLGYALYEDMPIDPETGAALAVTFADYRMPTAQVMPEIEVILVEKPGPGGPFGLKGVGEPGLGPTAAAIANAIYDAVGVRIVELPITPERVLRALQDQAAASPPP